MKAFHHEKIKTGKDFRETIRAGAYAWPGGYPLFLITSDGAALCFNCAKKEARNIIESIRTKTNDGWRIIACDVNYEDNELVCDHCNEMIESAYGGNIEPQRTHRNTHRKEKEKMKTYSGNDLTLSRATASDLVSPSGAKPTSRLLPDHQSDLVEWSESATIDGVPVEAYYMTTPEDEELAGESGAWDAINWSERLDQILIDIVACDRADIDDPAIDALIARLG